MNKQEQKLIEDYINDSVDIILHNLGFEVDTESFKDAFQNSEVKNQWTYILPVSDRDYAKIYIEEEVGYLDTIFWVMGFITCSRTGYTTTDIHFFRSQQCDSFDKFKEIFNSLIEYLVKEN